MNERQNLAAAAVLAIVLCFAGIGSHHLWSPDEPTGAAVGRAMLDSGNMIVPQLNGHPFLEKPPLYWWLQVAAFRGLGVSAAVARLPSALFSALTLLVAYALGRRVGGVRTGLLTVAVLGSTALFVVEAQRVVVDPALAFFVALAHLGFVILAEPRAPAERWSAVGLIALAVPLAFLSKGVVALGLAVAAPVFWLFATRRLRALRDLALAALVGVPTFALIVGAWIAALYKTGGWPAIQECLLNNTIVRFTQRYGSAYGHTQPVWYYLTRVPIFLLPWSIAIPAMLKAGLLRRDSSRAGSEARALLAATCGIGVLVLSAAASKRELYLLPLLPAFAVCVAWWLSAEERAEDTESRLWDRRTELSLLATAAALPLLIGAVALFVRWAPAPRAELDPLRAELSPLVVTVYGLVALGGSWLILRCLIRLRRQAQGSSLPSAWIVLPFLLLFFALETEIESRIDPAKRLSDLTAAILFHLPGDGPVPAYLLSKSSPESVYGIIGFDLGRRTLPLTTPEDLRSYLYRQPCARIVLRGADIGALPLDLQRRLLIVYDERGRKASPFLIAGDSLCPAERIAAATVARPARSSAR